MPYHTTSETPLGFTGEHTDPNGLLYLRSRYDAPPHGLFLTRDPVEGLWARSASRNGYGYVEGNPTNWTDPSGMYPDPDDTRKHCFQFDTCEQIEDRLKELIKILAKRIWDMFHDRCRMYFEFRDGLPRSPDPDCIARKTDGSYVLGDWAGHVNQAQGYQNAINNLFNCYTQRGIKKMPGFKHRPTPCQPKQEILEAVATWRSIAVADLKPRAAGGIEPPPIPNFAVLPPIPVTPIPIPVLPNLQDILRKAWLRVGIGLGLGCSSLAEFENR